MLSSRAVEVSTVVVYLSALLFQTNSDVYIRVTAGVCPSATFFV